MMLIRLLAIFEGVLLVGFTLRSAIRNFVLPRSAPDLISFLTFRFVRSYFNLRMRWVKTYEERDRIMAMYAPLSLLLLVPIWLTLVLIGYMGIYWGLGVNQPVQDFLLSGSSLLTLGFASGSTTMHSFVAFTEAAIGLILVALLIAYLPTMYSVFSQREAAVTQLAVRAGTPPSVEEFVARHQRIGKLTDLHQYWRDWEVLFSLIEESHTSLPALVFFRSPMPDQSWITAAGAVMDAAAFMQAAVDIPNVAEASLCIRAGFIALRRVCDFYAIPYKAAPRFPDDPISISREEFDAVYDRLAEQGVPLRDNRDQAWLDFAGWRVNYDRPLIAICGLVMAPYAPWSSDRSARIQLPPLKSRLRHL
ncbi:MAG: hypothetical protein U0175_04695 [Caldilineaceae bacterium]